jgi:glycosyltransferase involved in cell wall biosynthesis
MTRLSFSVIVPVFNAAEYLERCIRGLIFQTLPADEYEILMIDNNSMDESAKIIRGFDRVTLLQEYEQGSYAARNTGIREARGEIIAFTDPDCVPREDWLEQIGTAMAGPASGVVLGDRRFARDSGVLGILGAYESASAARIFSTERVGSYYGYTNNMAVRTSIVKCLGGFQQRSRGADTLLLRRAIEHYGPRVLSYAPNAVVRHLEIAGIHDYLEKKRIYGKTNGDCELLSPSPLPISARFELAAQVLRESRNSVIDRIAFCTVLAAGAMQFEWGHRMGGR